MVHWGTSNSCDPGTLRILPREDPKNGVKWKVVQVFQNKRTWNGSEVEDIENGQLRYWKSLLDIVWTNTLRMILCASLKLILQWWKDLMCVMSVTTSYTMMMNNYHHLKADQATMDNNAFSTYTLGHSSLYTFRLRYLSHLLNVWWLLCL